MASKKTKAVKPQGNLGSIPVYDNAVGNFGRNKPSGERVGIPKTPKK